MQDFIEYMTLMTIGNSYYTAITVITAKKGPKILKVKCIP